MKCDEIKELFIEFLDNENNVSDEIKTGFQNHLASCNSCAKEFEQFKILNNKLQNIKPIETDEILKNEFLHKLEEEKSGTEKTISMSTFYKVSFRIAASIILFISGSFFGYFITQKSAVQNLQAEVNFLQQSYAASILKEQTVSSKIKAINYFNGETKINPEFLSILEGILNTDDDVNVRIAAAKALFKYSSNKNVNNVLLKSLTTQTEPMVQIELIEFLVNNNRKQAIDGLKELLKNENTNYIVKEYANSGLKVLL